jgi:phosphatidylglycerophosphatase A
MNLRARAMPFGTGKTSRTDALAYAISIWFGCGLVPAAPGTAGSLGALPFYFFLRRWGTSPVLVAALAVTVVGLWASHRTARLLRQKDPQIICVDEVAGVLFTLAVVPRGWTGVIVGFVLFRVADQLKPWPARAAEQKLPGGWGIMLDDLAAAAWSMAVVLGARRLGWLV